MSSILSIMAKQTPTITIAITVTLMTSVIVYVQERDSVARELDIRYAQSVKENYQLKDRINILESKVTALEHKLDTNNSYVQNIDSQIELLKLLVETNRLKRDVE